MDRGHSYLMTIQQSFAIICHHLPSLAQVTSIVYHHISWHTWRIWKQIGACNAGPRTSTQDSPPHNCELGPNISPLDELWHSWHSWKNLDFPNLRNISKNTGCTITILQSMVQQIFNPREAGDVRILYSEWCQWSCHGPCIVWILVIHPSKRESKHNGYTVGDISQKVSHWLLTYLVYIYIYTHMTTTTTVTMRCLSWLRFRAKPRNLP